MAEAQNFARALVNEPGNVLTPRFWGSARRRCAREVGLQCEVYSTDEAAGVEDGGVLGGGAGFRGAAGADRDDLRAGGRARRRARR